MGLQAVEDSEPLLKRMLAAANAPILIGAQTVEIAASIGVAFYPEHGHEVDGLISKADQAMYLSKRPAVTVWRFVRRGLFPSIAKPDGGADGSFATGHDAVVAGAEQ